MNLALININQLVTVPSHGFRYKTREDMRDIGIIENGAVLIENDTIRWVGRMEELSIGSLKETEVLDCIDRVVMPGFVDSHTHLLFAGSRAQEFALRSAGATYQQIAEQGGGILSTVTDVRSATKKDLMKNARRWLTKMMRCGTTTVEIKSGYGLDPENEIKMLEAIQELAKEEMMTIVATFLGAHAVPPEYMNNRREYVNLITEKMIPYIASRKLASFCDVFCERGYFDLEDTETILGKSQEFGMMGKLHADELTPLGGSTLAARIGCISADHLEHVSDEGINALSKSHTVATLLPGVSFYLNHGYAPARRLIDAGVPVALATDFNPGSCMSYNMPLMMTIACTHMHMTPEEAITASTLNAAAALNLSDHVGSIEVGRKADCVVLDIPEYRFLAYHFGENHVARVVKNGVVLEF